MCTSGSNVIERETYNDAGATKFVRNDVKEAHQRTVDVGLHRKVASARDNNRVNEKLKTIE